MAAAPTTGLAAPFVLSGGLAYTLVGVSTELVVDVIIPMNEALQGDTGPALTTIGVEMSAVGLQYAGGQIGRKIAPALGPAYDVGNSLAPPICFGTGCR